eukprot:EG_transcript_1725
MRWRISFTYLLTALTLTLSLVPAVVIWVLLMDLRTASVGLLQGTTQGSMEAMGCLVQGLLMTQALENFEALLTQGDRARDAMVSLVRASGLQRYDLHAARFDFAAHGQATFLLTAVPLDEGQSLLLADVRGGQLQRRCSDQHHLLGGVGRHLHRCRDARARQPRSATMLYVSTLATAPDEVWTTFDVSYVDQVTGRLLIPLSHKKLPVSEYVYSQPVNFSEFSDSGWLKHLTWNDYTGEMLLFSERWLPALNNTWVTVHLDINTQTISEGLLHQLSGFPYDRLVLFTRQGRMIAASHGKYFSHSDVDRRFINPLTDPPDLSTYSTWNCTRSTDLIIQDACQQLYDEYRQWDAIPELRQEMGLAGQRYWVATGLSTHGMPCTVLMLKHRASMMGVIDASNVEVERSVDNEKNTTFAILGAVSAVAIFLPVAVGLWLASYLHTLAKEMDRIAQLQFTPATPRTTVFQELHNFQCSFTKMERGLEAFGRFVPQAVVKVLISGEMQASNEMHLETLTIMFADIEGFSRICENESPATLVAVCTEYFETMCSSIVQHSGTIDKFIGDCIMAMWNAPERVPHHEREAVAAALAMQTSVMGLHAQWQVRGLPALKFRLGLHTGVCLLGNFGCSYRVNYTCLGDGVNLSSRLEALNKRFGTYLCVSQATYEGCHRDFHFRRLAKVTVPGKAEVLYVYEALCEAQGLPNPELCSPMAPPGAVNLNANAADVLRGEFGDDAEPMPSAAHPYLQGDSASTAVSSDMLLGLRHPTILVAYHWTYVELTALLQHAREYQQAYDALVVGNRAEARSRLSSPHLAVPDPAWYALADQLEHCRGGLRWDGVFRFCDK